MSVTESVRQHIIRIPQGRPFTNTRFLKLGSRAAVDQALSRLVKTGMIQRVTRGIFVRPKINRFIGNVSPSVTEVIEVLAREYGETIQVHGAEAAQRLRLSTQVPTTPIFYTSGPSRELHIGELTVKLKHVSRRKLHLAGKKPGLALCALWYLGREGVNEKVINTIRSELSEEEYEALKNTDIPAWMATALNQQRYHPHA